MTKRRDPLTFHRALTVIAGRIGWDKCAMIVGRSERLVRMWSDPDADSEISIIDALRLDKAFLAAGGDHAPLHRVYSFQVDLETAAGDLCMTRAAASVAKESGEAVAALLDAALNPDDAQALRRARKEGEEALAALTDGLAALGRSQAGAA
ncbi:hypothetical protein [Novosphingobium pituita]|uniref:Uncharacterized protein n=1 Tax=Novosphingobium pituita TaxID=3056842 RepID=A0ABQ6P6A0_9SPHN|nr:hypothetical protein [Novosphingobium sp. IK01]GMM59892.1 hypothetical protein NUTIK01_06690 [Novosphingobium sp. IK01]